MVRQTNEEKVELIFEPNKETGGIRMETNRVYY